MEVDKSELRGHASVTFESAEEHSEFGSQAPLYTCKEGLRWINNAWSGLPSAGIVRTYVLEEYPKTVRISHKVLGAVAGKLVDRVHSPNMAEAERSSEISGTILSYLTEASQELQK